jgi:hypothetical protein
MIPSQDNERGQLGMLEFVSRSYDLSLPEHKDRSFALLHPPVHRQKAEPGHRA